ncbi:MAG: alanine--tRNA ligase [Planctomycetota bacterium]|nr:alanine--tRNA ligase [Planctomycetota bacterium]
MDAKTVRRLFLDYFVRNGHTEVSSAPLVPFGDPTLLFTNAGMNQFKNVFLGLEKRSYSRATSCQKCLRVSGKHNDLETVGRTERHHTFFEMLGNFSFGDYFKKEAIKFAWELLTEVYKIPQERLYATVYKDDYEAYEIWLREIGLPEEKIWKGGEKDNFWMMGDVGPCGPCSEVHYDKGEKYSCGVYDGKCITVACDRFGSSDCKRFFELWNLVFMEYEQHSDGVRTRLPKPSVDTGAGLERLCSVLQKVEGNFETDLFKPIIEHIEEISGRKYNPEEGISYTNTTSFRAIADHIRALVVCIADGVIPSNDGRGYVVRRILRRAFRQGRELGIQKPFLFRLVEDVVKTLGDTYPEIKESESHAMEIIRTEEENFNHTLDIGLVLLDAAIQKGRREQKNIISAEDAFRLYDTYGFPIDLTLREAEQHDFKVDVEGFEKLLSEQKEKSRSASKFEIEIPSLPPSLPLTEFVGYKKMRAKAKVLYATGDLLILDKTSFYAERGGQVSDTGVVRGKGFVFDVKKVQDYRGVYLHSGRFEEGSAEEAYDTDCWAEIDGARRKGIMRAHTATHLLHWALREALGKFVRQNGSFVENDRLRFDFTYHSKLSDEQLKKIEELVNQRVLEDHKVKIREMNLQDALKDGVIAIFEEKYGETVRVVKIGDFSKELCGGTHIERTSQICLFKIISERSVQAGVRRIEAFTGREARERMRSERDSEKKYLDIACKMVGVKDPASLIQQIEELRKERDFYKQENENLRGKVFETALKGLTDGEKESEELLKGAEEEKGLVLITKTIEKRDANYLRSKIDELKKRNKSNNIAICLTTVQDGKVVAVIGGKGQVIEAGFDAGRAAKIVGQILGGSGGGRKDFAQAGGPNVDKIDDALKAFEEYVKSL